MSDIQLSAENQLIESNDAATQEQSKFIHRVVTHNAMACHNINNDFNIDNAKKISKEGLTALRAQDGLQAMLAAQMLSVHRLQQRSMAYANALEDHDAEQYYTNTSIKLANCFVQQANLLAKLQGIGGQKIVVERVDVSDGGQAVIGSVNAPNRD